MRSLISVQKEALQAISKANKMFDLMEQEEE